MRYVSLRDALNDWRATAAAAAGRARREGPATKQVRLSVGPSVRPGTLRTRR